MSNTLHCPLCDWTIEQPDLVAAPSALAAVFGLQASALDGIFHSQNIRRAELDIERHMQTHPVSEWLPALMKARADLGQARSELSMTRLALVQMEAAQAS